MKVNCPVCGKITNWISFEYNPYNKNTKWTTLSADKHCLFVSFIDMSNMEISEVRSTSFIHTFDVCEECGVIIS